jgi:GNAT superfamily N-acetyltransferase
MTNLVAELDGQIIGFACVGPSRDDDTDPATCELWGLYLDPAQWGAGHGHILHTEALDVARASGAAAAILWVLTNNQRPATSTNVTAGQQTAQRRRCGAATCDWTRPDTGSH